MLEALPVLPHVHTLRAEMTRQLHGLCAADEAPGVVKRAIQHALNTGGQEACRALQREFPFLPAAFRGLLLDIGYAAEKVTGYLRESKGFQRRSSDWLLVILRRRTRNVRHRQEDSKTSPRQEQMVNSHQMMNLAKNQTPSPGT